MKKMIVILLCLVWMGCGGPTKTAHIYTNDTGGSVILCPEELDPAPTEWTYNGTATVPEDQVLSQCELQ